MNILEFWDNLIWKVLKKLQHRLNLDKEKKFFDETLKIDFQFHNLILLLYQFTVQSLL